MARTTLDTGNNGIQLQLEYGSLVDEATGGSITADTEYVQFSNLEAWIDANGYPFFDNSNKLTASGGWVINDSWTNIDIPTTSGTRKLKELGRQRQATKFGGTNGSYLVSLTLTNINAAGTLSGSYSRAVPRRPYHAPLTPTVTIGNGTSSVSALQSDFEADRYVETLEWRLETNGVLGGGVVGPASAATRPITMAANSKYRMSARALNEDGYSSFGYSGYWYTTPTTPVLASASRQTTKTQVLVVWSNPSAHATVSIVDRSNDGGVTWFQVYSGASTSFVDTVPLNATPRYRVRLQTPAGANTATSAYSNVLTVALGWAAPGAATSVSLSGSGGNMLVSWAGGQYIATADKYWENTDVELYNSSNVLVGSVTKPAGSGSTHSFSVAAAPGFYARVRGRNSNGSGGWTSSPWVYNAPGQPGSFVAQRVTPASASVLLTWTAASGIVDGYTVERGSSSSGPWTVLGTPAGLAFDTSLSPAQTAWYRVTARTPAPVVNGPPAAAQFVQVGLNTDKSKMPGVKRLYVEEERIVLAYLGAQRIWVDLDDGTEVDGGTAGDTLGESVDGGSAGSAFDDEVDGGGA